MTRDFLPLAVDPRVIEECVYLASRAPSAGKTQGWSLVGLSGDDTAVYWDAAFPRERRNGFSFPGLLNAGFVGVVVAEPAAYVERYSQPDKSRTGLGEGAEAWSVPYWTVDASMAAMTFLLAVHDRGLGALFFAVANEERVRAALAVPADVQIIGAVAVGVPVGEDSRPGRSASRPRRTPAEILRWGSWQRDAD